MSVFKEAVAFYKERKRQEKEKKILLNKVTNLGMLEDLIKRCNDNPNLKVRIFFADGTRYEISTYEPHGPKPVYEQINGLEVMDVQ